VYVTVAHLCVGGCVCVAAICSLDVSGGVPVRGVVFVVVDWEGIVM
jgi:hypothetical protein